MRIFLDTIGCRLNQAEIEQYARQLRAAGHTLVEKTEEAELAVVNTCLVTAAAESDSRQRIRQLHHAGILQVVVTGCWSSLNPGAAAALPGVRLVVANAQKDDLVPNLLALLPPAEPLSEFQRLPHAGSRRRTRAFIKAQDGCDNHCTFCITTLARGPSRSRPAAEVVAEINAAVGEESGAQEIVLTGVHLGAWGQDQQPRAHLRHLVQQILEQVPVPRLRLSSLEPWDLDDDFFSLWREARLCPHLHLALQSGSAATLKRMGRKTTPEAFQALVASARRAIPGVSITTDLIAGFPGESEEEFAESCAFVEQMQFAGGHVFTFSPRPGTAATRLPGQVALKTRKERSAHLRQRLEQASTAYQARYLGQEQIVLWEGARPLGESAWQIAGLTGNNLRVHVSLGQAAARKLWNTLTPVRLVELTCGGLRGEIDPYYLEQP